MTGSDPYTVRTASRGDLVAVLAVLAESQATASDGSPPPRPVPVRPDPVQRATWDRMLCTAGLTVYLAETGGEPAGSASMIVMPNLGYGCRPTAFIEAVVVRHAHRRRGVARLVLDRALRDARAATCQKVQLLSHKRHADDGAHGLYRSLGFSPEAEGFRLYLDRSGWQAGHQ